MNNDIRALCIELLEAVLSDDSHIDCAEIARRARAALAGPVGEGPSDEELLAMRSWSTHGPTFDSDLVDFARAVLARWGTPPAPAVVPVTVSERLPGEGDCDTEGRCWLLHVDKIALLEWHFLDRYPSLDSYSYYGYTHWLPHHAIPLPQAREVQP
jgi:hypothetical protein